ncbi:CopG family transcriptional regulator [Serratia ureilytica]
MSTTTIRIPDELKARVTAVAEQAGVTTHSFILQAIAEKTQQEELRRDFENEAEKRYAKIIATGETVSWKEMRGYLENYAAGNTDAVKPPVKNWGADGKCRVGARGQG